MQQLLIRLRREFQAFTLTPPKTCVIPIRYLMLVNTNRTSTSFSTRVKIRHTTNSNTSIRNWIFWERANLVQHPLWSADPFTNENFIRTPFSSPCTLQPLLLCIPFLNSKCLSCNNDRDCCPQKWPPNISHLWYYTTSAALSSNLYTAEHNPNKTNNPVTEFESLLVNQYQPHNTIHNEIFKLYNLRDGVRIPSMTVVK
jgi:hypothetical protein